MRGGDSSVRSRPSAFMLLLVASLLGTALSGGPPAAGAEPPDRFKKLPRGWTLVRSTALPQDRLDAFADRLGAKVTAIANTLLEVDGKQIQINTVTCPSPAEARKGHAAILRAHGGRAAESFLDGKVVYEFVSRDAALIDRARSELGFKRPKPARK
jgi:hypothetical protein